MEDPTDDAHADHAHHRGDEQLTIDRLWDFADPAASEERFRSAAADEARSTHERAVMLTQVARAIGIQHRDDEALALLDELEGAERDDETAEESAEMRARISLERGRIAAAAERFDDAVPQFTKAVREGAIAGSTFLVLDALHMLALNDAGHEEEWAAEGFDILDGVRDPRLKRWGVALHNNLGWTKHDAGDAVAALHHFELAVEAADRYGTAGQQHVARWSVGRALRTLGRDDEALELQRELALARPDDPYVRAEIEALEAGPTEAEPTIEA